MNKGNLCAVIVICIGVFAGTPAAMADGIEKRLSPRGQFQLNNGESVGLRRGKLTSVYRICMDDARHSVPLKVKHDGKEDIVQPGECQVIKAKAIRISSAGRLQEGMTLVGRLGDSAKRIYPALALVSHEETKGTDRN
jgi:hypothetical protein